MKRAELRSIYNFLGEIRINKIQDRGVRMSLMNIFISMRSAIMDIDENVAMIRDKYISGKEVEVLNHDTLIKEIQNTLDLEKRLELESKVDTEINQLVRDTNDAITEYLKGDIDIELAKIKREELMDIVTEQDINITFSALGALEPILM